MNCPACDRPRVEGDECPYCGVIYSRAHPRRVAEPPASEPPRATPPAGSRARIALWASLALAAGAVGAALAARRPTPPVIEASAPPAEAPQPANGAGVTAAASPAPRGADVLPEAAAVPAPDAPASPEPPSCARFDPSDIQAAPRPPAVSAEWHEGSSGYRRALGEHDSSGAPLLVLFYTDWCPHCRRFLADVIPSPEARQLAPRVAKAKVNAEGDADERALAARYGIRSYPAVLLFRADDEAPVRVGGTGSPRDFVDSCERAMPNPSLERLQKGIGLVRAGGDVELASAELKAAAADPALATLALDHLGLLALRSGCFATAARVYGRLLDLDAGYQGGRAFRLRGLARLRAGDRSGASQDAGEACRRGVKEACQAADGLRGTAR